MHLEFTFKVMIHTLQYNQPVGYYACLCPIELRQRQYCLSINFRDDLVFAFFAIYFKSQIHVIEYTEIKYCIIFYNKLYKWQRMTDTNQKCYRFSLVSQIFDKRKKTGCTVDFIKRTMLTLKPSYNKSSYLIVPKIV